MPKYRPGKEKFADLADFISQHAPLNTKVHNHRLRLDPKLSENALNTEERDGAMDLFADNFQARNAFACIVVEEVKRYVKGPSSDIDLHTAFIAPKKFVIPAEQVLGYAFGPLKRFVQRAMRGHDYVAMVEFAYYRRWPEGKPTISVHVHLITFGSSRLRLNSSLAAIRSKHESNIPGWNCADCKPITLDQLESKLLYMLKFPVSAYEPYPITLTNPSTGEVINKMGQHKPDLRPGELVKMADALRNQHLDKMLFGGGTGRALCSKTASIALEPLRRHEERQKAAAAYRGRLGVRAR